MVYRVSDLLKVSADVGKQVRAFTIRKSILERERLRLRQGLDLAGAARKLGVQEDALRASGIIDEATGEILVANLFQEAGKADSLLRAMVLYDEEEHSPKHDAEVAAARLVDEEDGLDFEIVSALRKNPDLDVQARLLNSRIQTLPKDRAKFASRVLLDLYSTNPEDLRNLTCRLALLQDPEKIVDFVVDIAMAVFRDREIYAQQTYAVRLAQKLYPQDVSAREDFVFNVAGRLIQSRPADCTQRDLLAIAAKDLYPDDPSAQQQFVVKMANKLFPDNPDAQLKFFGSAAYSVNQSLGQGLPRYYTETCKRGTFVANIVKILHPDDLSAQRSLVVSVIREFRRSHSSLAFADDGFLGYAARQLHPDDITAQEDFVIYAARELNPNNASSQGELLSGANIVFHPNNLQAQQAFAIKAMRDLMIDSPSAQGNFVARFVKPGIHIMSSRSQSENRRTFIFSMVNLLYPSNPSAREDFLTSTMHDSNSYFLGSQGEFVVHAAREFYPDSSSDQEDFIERLAVKILSSSPFYAHEQFVASVIKDLYPEKSSAREKLAIRLAKKLIYIHDSYSQGLVLKDLAKTIFSAYNNVAHGNFVVRAVRELYPSEPAKQLAILLAAVKNMGFDLAGKTQIMQSFCRESGLDIDSVLADLA